MTARTSRGQRILQGRRAKGTFTPSPGTLSAQFAASLIWPMFRQASGFVRDFWKVLQAGQTRASQFYAYAYDHAFTPDGLGGGTFAPESVSFSRGTMSPTALTALTGDVSANEIIVTFPTTNVDSSQLGTDEFWYVIYNVTQGKVISGAAGIRSAGTTGPIVPPAAFLVAGNQIRVYGTFKSDIPTIEAINVSNSDVLTATVTA